MIVAVIALHVMASRRVLFPVSVVGVAITAFLIAVIYPSFEETLQDVEIPEGFEGLLGSATDIASPEGYLQSQFFSFLPVITAAVGITVASYAIAGEERDGTLELVLAQPVTRRSVLLASAVGATVIVVLATLAAFPGTWLAVVVADIDIGAAPIWWASLASVPVALFFTWLTLWLSAASPSRAGAAGIASMVLIVTYLITVIGPINDVLDVLGHFTPFYWGDTSRALVGKYDYLRWIALTAVSLVFIVLGLWSFERREVSPGSDAWSFGRLARLPWRRGAETREATA
ncbi:MAG: ABC transporter permease subunit [Hyphomicrobiales bacterium]